MFLSRERGEHGVTLFDVCACDLLKVRNRRIIVSVLRFRASLILAFRREKHKQEYDLFSHLTSEVFHFSSLLPSRGTAFST